MKKYVILILFVSIMFLTTGCNSSTKTLNCTKTETDEDGYKSTETVVVTTKDDKVIKFETTNIMEMDADMVDTTISFGEAFASIYKEIEGLDASYTKESDNSVKYTFSVDYSKINIDKLKEEFGEDFKADEFYAYKDISLEDFKNENLEGYTCN